jgi:hypothetical protein
VFGESLVWKFGVYFLVKFAVLVDKKREMRMEREQRCLRVRKEVQYIMALGWLQLQEECSLGSPKINLHVALG